MKQTIIVLMLALLCGCGPDYIGATKGDIDRLQKKIEELTENSYYDANMRLNALEDKVFTNDIPPGTIRIPGGDHILSSPILIKKRSK